MSDHEIKDIIAPGLRVVLRHQSGQVFRPYRSPLRLFRKPLLENALAGGFTERQLKPEEELHLLDTRCGITGLVDRPTKEASELSTDELREGGKSLIEKCCITSQRRWRC